MLSRLFTGCLQRSLLLPHFSFPKWKVTLHQSPPYHKCLSTSHCTTRPLSSACGYDRVHELHSWLLTVQNKVTDSQLLFFFIIMEAKGTARIADAEDSPLPAWLYDDRENKYMKPVPVGKRKRKTDLNGSFKVWMWGSVEGAGSHDLLNGTKWN